jgi:hypothetical protein
VDFSTGSVAYGDTFWLDVSGFDPNTSFGGTASVTTPEPGTMILFLGGFGMFFAYRRVRTRQEPK